MSTPNVDLAKLTEPISPLMPSGESLRRSATYDSIKEARRADDPALAQGVWKTEPKKADWNSVESTCLDVLENKSKDLRVAAWLLESWMHKYGLVGAEQGMRLMESLCNRFWDTLHPPIEDGELDGRMAPFQWISDKVVLVLKLTPMTEPQTKESEVHSWMDWERASMKERAGQRGNTEGVTTAQFMTCVLLTPAKYYIKLDRELSELWQAIEDLERVVDKRCGQPMSALYQFRDVLKEMREFARRALDQKAEEDPSSVLDEGEQPAEQAEGAQMAEVENDPGGGRVRWGAIRNRAEAYQRLAEASDYLLRKEPHSPVPHLIKRAVVWGNMSFTELISELVQDQNDLLGIYGLLGINPPNQD